MKFIPIGIYGRYASLNGATNCHLIKDDGLNIIIDMGSGAFRELQKYVNVSEINTVILTHLHFDHIVDALTYQYYLEHKQANQVDIYLPSFPNNINELFASYKFNKLDIENIEGLLLNFQSFRVKHANSTDSYMLKIKGDSSTLLYTSDFSEVDEFSLIAKDADIIVADACVTDSEHGKKSPHASIGSIARTTPKDSILYLTHLTDGREAEILAEARLYHEKSYLIAAGQQIEF